MYVRRPTQITPTERTILTGNGTFGPPIAETAAIATIASTGEIAKHQIMDRMVHSTDRTIIIYTS